MSAAGIYSKPVELLVARLQGHAATGKILEGFKFAPLPVEDAGGKQDLPSVRLWIPSVSEGYRPQFVWGARLQFNLTVATAREGGIVGLMEAVEKVMDAAETDPTTNAVDPGLSGTLMTPFSMAVQNVFALDLSLNAELTLQLEPRPRDRGRRR